MLGKRLFRRDLKQKMKCKDFSMSFKPNVSLKLDLSLNLRTRSMSKSSRNLGCTKLRSLSTRQRKDLMR